MAVPKKRRSASKQGMRRSHDKVEIPNVIYCQCGETTLSHRVCPSCGEYRGRQYLRTQENG